MTSKEDLQRLFQQYQESSLVNIGDDFHNLVNTAIKLNVRFGLWEISSQKDMDNFAQACKLYSQGMDYSDALRSAIYDKQE